MGRQWPESVVNALRCVTALAGLLALGTLLTVLFEGDLIRSWAEGNPGAREILREGGVEALKSSSITPPAFVPVVVVLFVVMLSLFWVLRVFVREGYEWARVSLAAVGLLLGLGAVIIAFREDPPLVFVLLAGVTLLVDAALMFFLFHPDTTDHIHGAWLVHHDAVDVAESPDPTA